MNRVTAGRGRPLHRRPGPEVGACGGRGSEAKPRLFGSKISAGARTPATSLNGKRSVKCTRLGMRAGRVGPASPQDEVIGATRRAPINRSRPGPAAEAAGDRGMGRLPPLPRRARWPHDELHGGVISPPGSHRSSQPWPSFHRKTCPLMRRQFLSMPAISFISASVSGSLTVHRRFERYSWR